jgi:signal transduction histidine kinase/CheY-like chemotaxis protein
MAKHTKNQTYRDLQSLFRLFLASIFIIGGLNYVFTGLIDDLGQETKNLQIKKSIEEKISQSINSAKDDFSQILLSSSDKNLNHIKENVDKELRNISDYATVLRLGGNLKLNDVVYQTVNYQPKLYSSQYDNYNRLSLEKLQQGLAKLKNSLILFYNKETKNQTDTQKVIKQFETIKANNDNQLRQTIYQINKINSKIQDQKEKYTGYELLAIIFVISSLLYMSNLISNQILKNSDSLEESNKKATQMAEKSKQASKAKSEFLANMSHEIRTPLNAILGFIDLLKEKESDGEKLKYINTIQSSSTTLLGIINDILDFSKIESGNLNVEKVDFNTHQELGTLADLFRAKASEKSVSLTFNIDKDIPKALKSDPLRLKQIIANMLSNAIKFTPRNGRIELLIKYTENQHLLVSVKDNGIGIAEDKQADIFKAFSQAESSTTRKYGGTGLGLAISAKLVSMLGGQLKLESQLEHGSRFYFEIPVEVGVYKKPKKVKANEYDAIKGKKILLVEDNKANQMFMSLILKKFGLIFDMANDGIEAVTAYKKDFYDLVLMDENMPNLNGIEATKQILAFEKEQNMRHTPIVALTANALKGDRERFLEAGMDEYLTKPLDKEKLAIVLNNFLISNKEEEIA